MTKRAVLLGLVGAVTICGITFFNDMVMRGTFLVGNFLPVSVFGTLILFLLLVNPCLGRLGQRAPLRGSELAVIMALTLFACFLPGRGLMHQFTTFLMLPHHHMRTIPGWQGEPTNIGLQDIADVDALTRALTSDQHSAAGSVRGYVLRKLPAEVRDRTTRSQQDESAFLAAALPALNNLLDDPELARLGLADDELLLPAYVLQTTDGRVRVPSHEEDLARLNRSILDVLFPGALSSRKPSVLEHAPPRMLADVRENSTVVLDGFVNGLAVGDEPIAFSEIPFGPWKRTLLFWVPLVLALSVAIIGLSLVLHRQWSDHEHLPYPTVEFVCSLLPASGHTRGEVFRNRLFWGAIIGVVLLHMNNYAYVWWPEKLIRIQTRFDFWPLVELVPIFKKANVGIWNMFHPSIYFTVIGFAYFLSTDISLSLGIAPYVFAIAVGILAGYGVSIGGAFLQPSISPFLYAGSYCGMFLVLVYTGRRYYTTVFKRGFFLPARDPAEPHAVWGARAFVIGCLFFVAQLVVVGLDWQIAVLYTFITIILLVVISRLVAEAGVFYLHAYFFPCALLWGFLGATSVGPDQLLIMGMVSSVLLIDPREALMPYVVSGLQLADRSKVKVGRTATWGMAAIVLGFAVAIPATLYWQYRYGAIRTGDGWTCNSVPKFVFNANSVVRRTLEAQGTLSLSENLEGWQRFGKIMPAGDCLIGFAVMFSLVVLFTFLRHRFAWWPLHPLLFLVLATWQSRMLAFSFLLGWLVKSCVTKYGGASLYQKLKPLMVGLVAGEMLAAIIPMIIGAAYYFITGEPPESFSVYR